MTFLEIMLVLGIMGMLMVLGSYTVRAVTKSALRADATEVAAALKAARNLAAESGVHHRVVFDLDQQTYRVEACPDPVQMKREDSEETRPDQEALARLAAQPNPLAGPTGLAGAGPAGALGPMAALSAMGGPAVGAVLGEVADAASPEEAVKAAAAIAGVRVGTARCGVASAAGGDAANFQDKLPPNVHKLDADGSGVAVRRIHVAHLRDPVTKGEVSVHFFPLGQAEKAIVEVTDKDGDQFSVLLHGLTARVEIRDGEIDPDKHMRRDAAGDEVDEP